MHIIETYKRLKPWNYMVAQENYLTKQKKNGENVPSIEVVKVFLVQGNLADNQYQQKSEVFFEPTNLVFLKTYNNEFDEIILTFTNQNGRPLEIEDKVNLTLPLNRNDTSFYRTKRRKCFKGYGFLSFAATLPNKYRKKLLDTATKTALDKLKTASKKIAHKAAEATSEFIGNKIADKIVKPKPVSDENFRNVEEIIFSTRET